MWKHPRGSKPRKALLELVDAAAQAKGNSSNYCIRKLVGNHDGAVSRHRDGCDKRDGHVRRKAAKTAELRDKIFSNAPPMPSVHTNAYADELRKRTQGQGTSHKD